MEGKGLRAPLGIVIMGVLILGLFLAQIQVEARPDSCCKNTSGRNCYKACRLPDTPRSVCAKLCDCTLVAERSKCPSGYPSLTLGLSSDDIEEANINDYCSLGCTSSVCNAISTLHNSDVGSEAAVKDCNKACSIFCNKGVKITMSTA